MAFRITEVQKSLKGVDYPASKGSFDGPNAVMKELKGSLTGSGNR
jgi:hypothetical protein